MSDTVCIFDMTEELYVTLDTYKIDNIRTILEKNNIAYREKVFFQSRNALRGRLQGNLGIREDSSCTFKIYVERKDYDIAKHVIDQIKK